MEVTKREIYQTALDCVRGELDVILELDDELLADSARKFERVVEYLENEVDKAKIESNRCVHCGGSLKYKQCNIEMEYFSTCKACKIKRAEYFKGSKL